MKDNDLKKQFQEIIDSHKAILYKVAHTYCTNEEDRKDLIQEIMIQIWKSIPNYNEKYAITTWLYRISLNVAISFFRKNKARKVPDIFIHEHHTQFSENDANEKEYQLGLLEKFISELNDFDKALILLYLENKSHSEISEILGISVTNVSTKTGRIKDKLKKRFSQIKN